MDWIFDNFQIVALVALAMASWFKSRMDAKAAEREEQRAREEMAERGELEEYEYGPGEPWQEVLMQPEPAPPPLVRASPPPVPVVVAVAQNNTELKRQMELEERLRLLRETKVVTSGGAAATRNLTASRQTGYAAPDARHGLREVVRKRGEIRRAIVLREILGPPLALRHAASNPPPGEN